MIVKTTIFELCDRKYNSLSELAQAMGISISQVYRVREGKRNINQKFIIGAMKAFPRHKFDDLFYFSAEPLTVTSDYLLDSTDESAAKEKQRTERIQRALDRFTSATEVHENARLSDLRVYLVKHREPAGYIAPAL